MTKIQSIFVAVASYRDTELRFTITDLFKKALYPRRIKVGIIFQYIPGVDEVFSFSNDYSQQISCLYYDARESLGPSWAKAKAHGFWSGELYTLNIDSHMRFAPGWDQMLIELIQSCDRPEKTIISAYPPSYIPPNSRSWDTHVIVPSKFENGGSLRFTALKKSLPQPVSSLFLSGNFFFCPSHFIIECPYDPTMYQSGEEITMSVRAWTLGWNICCPHRPILFHYYGRESYPKLHLDRTDWYTLHQRAEHKVRILLESNKFYREKYILGRKYGLGRIRSIEDFQTTSGTNFTNKRIEEWAKNGIFKYTFY